MSEIEKLYKNAGVKNKYCCKSSQCIVTNPYPEWCNKCESLIIKYPEFTAEKQLELIKYILKKFNFFSIEMSWNEYACADCWISCYYRYTLEESIANYFNTRWQDLTEQERTEIAEILKG